MKKEYDFSKARRGPIVPPTPGKTRVTIRLDNDILEHFLEKVDRAGGGNYQTLINDALREYMQGAVSKPWSGKRFAGRSKPRRKTCAKPRRSCRR